MGYQDFISETEAASLAGVSVKTLNRFAEAGYFHLESDNDGLRLFSKSELLELFGMQARDAELKERSSAEQVTAAEQISTLHEEPGESAAEVAPMRLSQAVSETLVNQIETIKEDRDTAHEQNGTVLKTRGPVVVQKRAIESLLADSDKELTKYKNIIELQEKLLDARELEIKDLKEQRDWLRTRIEKLEEKGDRDQLLLLSEAQTVKRLVMLQTQPKQSPLRLALEWIGLVPASNPIPITTPSLTQEGAIELTGK